MNKEGKTTDQIIYEIKIERKDFNLDNFLDMVDIKFKAMYKALKAQNYDFIKNICTDNYYDYIKVHAKEVVKLNSDIDFIAIQNKKLKDYRRNDSCEEIDVDLIVYYIDYMNNNKENYHPTIKKYNEYLYRVTFSVPSYQLKSDNSFLCDCCGAIMKRHLGRNIYSCDYCGYIKALDYNDWKISNIKDIT